ncbi:MAG: hypothetical protein ACTSUU_04370 [Candidatus Thorarchaeota archaeon]
MTEPSTRLLRFIQVMPRAPVDGHFRLRDLPSSGKRIDLLCRVLAAAFDWGPDTWPRSRIEVMAVLGNAVRITFHYPAEQLPVGERAWATVIRDALQGHPPPFVTVDQCDLRDVVRELTTRPSSRVWVLEENGDPFRAAFDEGTAAQNSFMLGNHVGLDSVAQSVVKEFDIPRLTLGRRSMLSSHCISTVISEFERMT